jgi:putative FmdB family regulatory protein
VPVYTYRCESCGVQFDIHQSFNDQPLSRCPECNKKTLRKVYLPVGIVFKGKGFYSTDHRSPSGSSHSGKEKNSTEKKSSESETKSTTGDKAASTPTEK